jgi:hypothetical protein
MVIKGDRHRGRNGGSFFSVGGKFQGWELWEECTYVDLSKTLTQVQREPTRAAIATQVNRAGY